MNASLARRLRLASVVAGTLVAAPLLTAVAAAAPASAAPLGRGAAPAPVVIASAGAPAAPIVSAGAATQDLLDLMAQAKADTDLGHYEAAIGAFTAIADAPGALPALRAEALVRLGAARRGAGDLEGAMQAFERASKAPGTDAETKALLVRTLGGALPGAERWTAVWSRVSFAPDRSDPKRPTLEIVWPDVPRKQTYTGEPITIDFKEGDLQDLFRLFADISGLNVVVSPGIGGKVTFTARDQAWDRCLDLILAANGLAYRLEESVLFIARPQQIPPRRRYSGQKIDVDYKERDLNEVLVEIAATGGAGVEIDPAVAGKVTLKLNQVRWDQAFDIVVRVNGLDWTQDGKTLKVFPGKRS